VGWLREINVETYGFPISPLGARDENQRKSTQINGNHGPKTSKINVKSDVEKCGLAVEKLTKKQCQAMWQSLRLGRLDAF